MEGDIQTRLLFEMSKTKRRAACEGKSNAEFKDVVYVRAARFGCGG